MTTLRALLFASTALLPDERDLYCAGTTLLGLGSEASLVLGEVAAGPGKEVGFGRSVPLAAVII